MWGRPLKELLYKEWPGVCLGVGGCLDQVKKTGVRTLPIRTRAPQLNVKVSRQSCSCPCPLDKPHRTLSCQTALLLMKPVAIAAPCSPKPVLLCDLLISSRQAKGLSAQTGIRNARRCLSQSSYSSWKPKQRGSGSGIWSVSPKG